jgi:hypothetical protein
MQSKQANTLKGDDSVASTIQQCANPGQLLIEDGPKKITG